MPPEPKSLDGTDIAKLQDDNARLKEDNATLRDGLQAAGNMINRLRKDLADARTLSDAMALLAQGYQEQARELKKGVMST